MSITSEQDPNPESRQESFQDTPAHNPAPVSEGGSHALELLPAGVYRKEDGLLYIRARRLSGLYRQADNLNRLMDAARSIMAEKELNVLLELIMNHVTNVMRADRSTLFLVDNEKNELWSRIAQGSSEIRLPIDEGIAGHVVQTGETIYIDDAYADSRFNPEFDNKTGYRTSSMICMPIIDPRGEIIGAIEVLNKLDGQGFTTGDGKLLQAFSSLAGISLVNAWAYEELGRERDLLEERVLERTKDLEESRKKSDELLLNILPYRIAEELKSQGRAKPRRYDLVTVFFIDFKGFTQVVEAMDPERLLEELNECFLFFDEVIERYNLEKIKTMGDSYMCAGGVPHPNRSHALEAALAALEINEYMKRLARESETTGRHFWEIRQGIHTGPVIAGVIGKKKFAYDIWGDTVNTASRMESSGEPGRINISAATFELIREYFECTNRGKIPTKHKGEVEMYFIDRIKSEYAADDEGTQPNSALRLHLDELRS